MPRGGGVAVVSFQNLSKNIKAPSLIKVRSLGGRWDWYRHYHRLEGSSCAGLKNPMRSALNLLFTLTQSALRVSITLLRLPQHLGKPYSES